MSSRTIEEALEQFERALAGSSFHLRVKRTVPFRLRRSVRLFCELPANRGGRGLRHAVKVRICRILDYLRWAVGHADDHEDANVRTSARQLVRSILPLPFDQLDRRASKFVGLLRRVGHRRRERRLLVARPTFWIGDLEVAELVSSDQLTSVGRELELCVAHPNGDGRTYHDALREGDSKFYRLAKEGRAIGLIDVDVDEMRIDEAQGPEGDELRLQRKTAFDLLRRTETTADDVDAFARVGAFGVFLDGTPRVPAISGAGCLYRVWVFPDKKRIAVAKTSAKSAKVSWSLFRRQDPRMPRRRRRTRGRPRGAPVSRTLQRPSLGTWIECCYHDDAMCVGEFLDLLIRCPEIARMVRTGSTSAAPLA